MIKETRRQIYEIVNNETQGVILTRDQPLDEAASRILETMRKLKGEVRELIEERAGVDL